MYVRITGCHSPIMWYIDRIGDSYEVEDNPQILNTAHVYFTVNNGSNVVIDRWDCQEITKEEYDKSHPQPIFSGGVGVLVVDHAETKILLGHRSDGQGWCAAGGKMEPGERIYDAAVRELYEEFGIRADNLCPQGHILCCARISRQRRSVRSYVYKYFLDDYDLKTEHDQEMMDIRWFTPAELMKSGDIYPPTLICINKFLPDWDAF